MTSYLSVTDLFAGAGGSSTGLSQIPDVEIKTAANHWKIALDSHAENHPNTIHMYGDLRKTHPAQFAKTTMLWASPECTKHSIAGGKARKNIAQRTLWGDDKVDPDEERSRATMREVVEYAEYHRYPLIVVENVSEIRLWAHYTDWLKAMDDLGYDYKEVFFNSMHVHPTPQSRDRIYVCFWLKGNRKPDLDLRPTAYCETCGKDVQSRWGKKNPKKPLAGRVQYGKSYVYVCPHCFNIVEPYYYASANIIDWSIPTPLIRDRSTPLKPNTMARIQRGIDKYMTQYLMVDMSHPSDLSDSRTRDMMNAPMSAITGRNNYAAIMPHPAFIMQYYGRDNAHSPLDAALPTVTGFNNGQALVTAPSFVMGNHHYSYPRMMDEPSHTATASSSGFYVKMPFIAPYYSKDSFATVTQALPTQPTKERHALVIPSVDIMDCGFRMLTPDEVKAAMAFPHDYIILGTKEQRIKQLGNAVTPPVAQEIGRRMFESLA